MSDDLVEDSAPAEPEFALDLKRYTPARVSLGQTGTAIPTHEQLRFQLDHARARDAVHARLDVAELQRKLRQHGMDSVALRSVAVRGGDRRTYLRRPDFGRKLDAESADELKTRATSGMQPDVVFVLADGLSALAVERHAIALLDEIRAGVGSTVSVAPVAVVSDGRVAVGDEIGHLLGAKLAVVLIGERPGLSSPDSLGVYITWDPKPGRTDAERNCISNIRTEGLSYSDAAQRILYYMREAQRLGQTGVMLKERPGIPELS
jgi:ethanolamine ammonia-lyase small subunit